MARTPKRITETYLQRVALWYLERWDAPVAGLRRVLVKRVHRSARHHGDDPAEGLELADRVVARCVENGLVDDRRYAEAALTRLRERGASRRRIQANLASKGVPRDVIDELLAADPDHRADAERLAAIRYARRRSFGPWRRHDARDDAPRRELASMARAGFDYDTARRILDADDPHALEDEIPRGW